MIPVILDTDLGSDIDDHWAVAMILGCPELDVRLITTASGDTTHRAQLLSGLLGAAGRTDIPIGIGPSAGARGGGIARYAAEHPLADYPGEVIEDGVQAIIDTMRSNDEPVTVVTIGPLTNLGHVLDREPEVARGARLVAMAGNLRGNIHHTPAGPQPEYNVISDIAACRRVLEGEWEITLAPFDTCAGIWLDGERYAPFRDPESPLLSTVRDNYREWMEAVLPFSPPGALDAVVRQGTTILCDTLAILLAYREEFVVMEDLQVWMDDSGVIAEAPTGRFVRAATTWRDLDGFLDHLASRLVAAGRPVGMSGT